MTEDFSCLTSADQSPLTHSVVQELSVSVASGTISKYLNTQESSVSSTGKCSSLIASVAASVSILLHNSPTVHISVRPSTPFSADTDTPIFCCQSNTIPIRYRFFATLQERTWRRVTDRSKASDAATNNSGAPRTRCSAAADAFDLS